MTSAIEKLLDVIIGALNLFRFWVVLDINERGVLLRLGKLHREIGSGLHWRIPFKIDELQYINIKQRTTNSWDMTFPLNGESITLSFSALIEVSNAAKVILELNNWERSAYATIKIAISESVNKLLEKDPKSYLKQYEFTKEVKDHITVKLNKISINLVDFGFQEVAKTRAYKLFNGVTK